MDFSASSLRYYVGHFKLDFGDYYGKESYWDIGAFFFICGTSAYLFANTIDKNGRILTGGGSGEPIVITNGISIGN